MKFIISIVLLVMIFISYWYVSNRIEQTGNDSQIFDMDVTQAKLEINHLEGLGNYDSIIERPLFVPERQFEEVKKPVVKKVRPVVKTLSVKALGVAVTNEDVLAVLKNLTSGKIIRMKVGDVIEGWTLDGVSEDSFIFSMDNQQKIIKFKN